VLLFVDPVAGNANVVIVLEGQLNSFPQCYLAWGRHRTAYDLCRRNAAEEGCRE
jgi:hypothetical protein